MQDRSIVHYMKIRLIFQKNLNYWSHCFQEGTGQSYRINNWNERILTALRNLRAPVGPQVSLPYTKI